MYTSENLCLYSVSTLLGGLDPGGLELPLNRHFRICNLNSKTCNAGTSYTFGDSSGIIGVSQNRQENEVHALLCHRNIVSSEHPHLSVAMPIASCS